MPPTFPRPPILSAARRRSPGRRSGRRKHVALGLLAVVAAAVLAVALVPGPHHATAPGATSTIAHGRPTVHRRTVPRRLEVVARTTGTLQAPLQDAAAAIASGSAVALLAGLDASDVSTADVRIATAHTDELRGRVPTAVHDAAAARLAGVDYLFGGGDGVRQHDEIYRVDTSGTAILAGRLPAASSDQAAAAIRGTAYVVGGYTGSAWLDTIVAYRPGGRARVVAHLPTAVRYAAVAAVGRTLVIAGGSLPNGSASNAIYSYAPGNRVRLVGRLPVPTTHAAAAAVGTVVLVVGGRGTNVDTPTRSIVAVDPARRTVRRVGILPQPLSDEAAVGVGHRVLVFGGRSPGGTVGAILALTPRLVALAPAKRATGAAVDVYAADGAGDLTGAARSAKPLVYVPNSQSDTLDVIDPSTFKVVAHYAVGGLPQHVVPAWDLKTLYVTNDIGNSLTPIDPRTGKPGRPIPVTDPYNMYFTPDGSRAIVVAEAHARLDFTDPHTFRLLHALPVPCRGVDHMDFTAGGGTLLASCEFSGQLVRVDVRHERVLGVIDLPDGAGGMPQDVKLSPDGRIFYVADMMADGVWKVSASTFKIVGFLHTGRGTHGLYVSRDARDLYVTNRSAGTVSVVSFATGKVVRTWTIPGGSPDMGGVSADGKVLWLSGRYNSEVYAISTVTGRLLARIPVGRGPHGLCVWPQPGRYSLGHTGILR
jgi:YVTN family beta-propeller protein